MGAASVRVSGNAPEHGISGIPVCSRSFYSVAERRNSTLRRPRSGLRIRWCWLGIPRPDKPLYELEHADSLDRVTGESQTLDRRSGNRRATIALGEELVWHCLNQLNQDPENKQEQECQSEPEEQHDEYRQTAEIEAPIQRDNYGVQCTP